MASGVMSSRLFRIPDASAARCEERFLKDWRPSLLAWFYPGRRVASV